MDKSEFECMVAEAQNAFWRVISEKTNLKTGDLDVDSSVEFDRACAKVVQAWTSQQVGFFFEMEARDGEGD